MKPIETIIDEKLNEIEQKENVIILHAVGNSFSDNETYFSIKKASPKECFM